MDTQKRYNSVGPLDFISENGSEIAVYSTSNQSGHFFIQFLKGAHKF